MAELAGKRILVIDDDEPIREYLRHVLEDEGCEAIVACDGREGLEKLEENPCHAVVTDLSMSGTDGIDTIIAIRNKDARLRIIAMSGVESKDRLLQIADMYGANGVLRKPFEREDFLSMLRDLIG